MIPDEIEPTPINFVWIRFIGRKKLELTDEETMALTPGEFTELYDIYKQDFDLELLLSLNRKTYEQTLREAEKSQEWL